MTKSIRIHRRREKNWRLPENTMYVGRRTTWGNPFLLEDGKSREEIVLAYRKYAEIRLRDEPDWLEPLRGKNLACWCPLEVPCHADILLEYLNKEVNDETQA